MPNNPNSKTSKLWRWAIPCIIIGIIIKLNIPQLQPIEPVVRNNPSPSARTDSDSQGPVTDEKPSPPPGVVSPDSAARKPEKKPKPPPASKPAASPPETKPEPPASEPAVLPQESYGYNVVYNEHRKRWEIRNDVDNDRIKLPQNIIPAYEGAYQLYGGYREFDGMQISLFDRLRKDDISSSELREHLNPLTRVKVNGQQLFPKYFLTRLIKEKSEKEQTAPEVEPEPEPPTVADMVIPGTEPDDGEEKTFSGRLGGLFKVMNMDENTFIQEFGCLKHTLINSRTRISRNKNITLRLSGNCRIGNQRSIRIRGKPWMRKRSPDDQKIFVMWLQLRTGGTADGLRGPGTRKNFLARLGDTSGNRWIYDKKVAKGNFDIPYSPPSVAQADVSSPSTRGTIPPDEAPDTPATPVDPAQPAGLGKPTQADIDTFNEHLIDWGQDIGPSLQKLAKSKKKSGKISYRPKGGDRTLHIRIRRTAAKRIRARKFGAITRGRISKDQVIYLQYLAVLGGKSIKIDGGWGPKTRNALKDVLSKGTVLAPEDARVVKHFLELKGR